VKVSQPLQGEREKGSTMSGLVQDGWYALRRLTHTPSLAIAVVVTLALGIGGNAAVFSVVNGLLLKPHGSASDPRLMKISLTEQGRRYTERMLTGEHLEHLEARRPAQLEVIGGIRQFRTVAYVSGESRVLIGEAVYGDYFALIGARPVIGALFAGERASDGGVVVISERLWRGAFGASPDVLGTTIVLGGGAFTIVGVLPSRVRGLVLGNLLSYDVWVPRGSAPGLSRDDRGLTYLIGRLRPGVSVDAARTEMRVIGANLDPGRPAVGLDIEPLSSAIYHGPAPFFVAAGAVLLVCGLVFLAAAANLANLLLASVVARTNELAVRQMLGADGRRIVRLLALEISLMVVGGLALGGFVATATIRAIATLPLPERGGVVASFDASPDWRVFAFAGATALAVAGTLTALLARHASKVDALQAMSSLGGGGGSTSAGRRLGFRLVAVQVAASLALLVNAGTVVRATTAALSWDPGFDIRGAVVGRIDGRLNGESWTVQHMNRVSEQIRSAPGVDGAAVTTGMPGDRNADHVRIANPGAADGGGVEAQIVAASPTFVHTLGLKLVRGRDIMAGDARSAHPVVVLSERVTSLVDLGPEPIGQFVTVTDRSGSSTVAQVVGLVSDVQGAMGMASPLVIVPLNDDAPQQVLFVVRGRAPDHVLMESLRAAARTHMPSAALQDTHPLAQELAGDLWSLRRLAVALSCIAAIGVAIAVSGLYSVASYRTARRGRELALRVALGATNQRLYGLVLSEMAMVVICGVGGGLAAAVPIGYILRSILPRVPVVDPLVVTVVPVIFLLVTLWATAMPLTRIMKRDPSIVLREL
jgi:putative ABC transport system permease protein